MKYWIIILLCLLYFVSMGTRAAQSADKTAAINSESEEAVNIVVLLTYNPILPWSQSIIAGIAQASSQQKQKVNVYVESLYTGAQTQNYIANFVPGLEDKYSNTHIDAFITDSALSNALFSALLDSEQFTAAEKFNFAFQPSSFYRADPRIESLQHYSLNSFNRYIEFMFEALPKTRDVYINTSIENIYDIHVQTLQTVKDSNKLEFEIHPITFNSVDDAQQQLQALPEDSIFIYLPVFSSKTGPNLTPKAFLQAIAPFSAAPIFSVWVTFMGDGIVGGYIFDPQRQGESMIKVVMEKLTTGRIIKELPYSSWMFDQQQTQKYGISIPDDVLPQYIFNGNTNVLIDYPLESAVFLILIAAMGVIVFCYRHIQLAKAMHEVQQATKQAKESAIAANRSSQAKSKFLANISHEIRTPINGMFGVLNILGKTKLDEQQNNLMQMGRFCTDTLLRTVNDVLDFSKLESSQLQLKQIGFSPVQLLKESYAYALLISDEKPLQINLEIDRLIDVPLLGDQTRIRQIFDNLISNAVKFTSTGSIAIGANIRPENSHYIMTCWVNDTGEGIAKNDVDRLFQPFVQIEDSYSKSRSGTGLGLALCKELVGLMQGNITMKSELGSGTNITFTIHLPLADSVMEVESEVLDVDLARLQQANILFVEDNPINQEITIVQLEYYGINMTVLNNGQECIDHLLSTEINYDVILMDIQMPIMNGYDASVAIRSGLAGKHNQHIPIIALTAHVSLEEQQKALQAGINKHINKPIVPEQLLKAIEECLSQ